MSDLKDLEAAIPALRRYGLALVRNPAEADDLVQDTLVRAIDRIGTRSRQDNTRAWLFTIMHNLFVSRWRRLRRQAAIMVHYDAADAPSPPAQVAAMELAATARALETLPLEQQQVLLLVTVEGFSYAEVAGILGIPIGTVMSRLSRARDRLNERMDGKMNGRQRPVLRSVT